MPRKPKAKPVDLPAIPAELLEQFGSGPMTAEAINAATLALKKALIERALGGEMNHHLGYPPGAAKPATVTNQRNGSGAKTVLTEDGPIRIEVPRDRDGSFEPLLIPKHERRFKGFDDKIVAMYARGMTVREIQGFLLEQYATEVSPEFISSVTDEVMAEVTAWQARPLDPMYPVVFFDALRVKIRETPWYATRPSIWRWECCPTARVTFWACGSKTPKRQVLDEGVQRPQDARRGRHPDRRDGRPQGHARSAGGRVSGDHAADLHRSPDPQQPRLCELEGP
ncbi:transposase [Ralstonia solanacearum CFBP2957]|nr:transposase [Ralstonia solanacearum CFBP2957]